MSAPIRLHWSRSKPNFGDALSPLICEAVSGRKIVYESVRKCDLLATGSLLQRLPEHIFSRRLHVWGSGFIKATAPHHSRHHYHAVRGDLSRQIVKASTDLPVGDPGLLSHLLLSGSKPSTQFAIGIVAHYKDKQHPLLKKLNDQYPEITVIDIFLPPAMFLQRLQTCEVIFSSAMHGLIAADSLAIANARIKLSEDIRGGDFKFNDYYSIFNMSATPLELHPETIFQQAEQVAEKYQRPNLTTIQKQLINAFPNI